MRIGIGIGLQFIKSAGLDPATSAFITAAGITDPTQINAINRLVLNYKGQGNLNSSVDLWTGSNAIYPIVGGSATSHMYNLKDPRNLDAAFRLAFSGGWTHSNNGMLPNGVNAFANTFLTPNSNIGSLLLTIGVYIRTNNTTNLTCDIGVTNTAVSAAIELFGYLVGNNTSGSGDFANRVSYATTDTRGFKSFSRTANNLIRSFDRGVFKAQNITTDSTLVTGFTNPIYIGARNLSNTVNSASNRENSFAHIGSPLNDANTLILNNIIQQFQTDLGRNV